jgi:glutamate formiminotransferase
LIEAACRLCLRALEEIDLRTHRGAHPRLGAVDVVPFVPLLGTPMALAVETARAAGAAIAERCGLPVMLYEAAASDPTRLDLARHRRGGLAALASRMASGEWPPDFGPSTPHPTAGVVCVGARMPLVAFNLVLDTAEVETAREIARRIRMATPGGLPGVKAIGLYLESRRCVQVSVNLVDCQRTTLGALVRRVRDEAHDLGARVSTTELVGLAPLGAVLDAAAAELLLPGLEESQILESRLLEPGETLTSRPARAAAAAASRRRSPTT